MSLLTETAFALSGGRPDGAFRAGVLYGWTQRGDRAFRNALFGRLVGAGMEGAASGFEP